jgi:competence protein ComEC
LTSLVAGTATAPYAVFDFNRMTTYGLAANMIAVPVTAFWIMPWGLLALCLMPLGLEQLALAPMGWGIAVVVGAARTVSAWPGALHIVASPPPWSILLVTFGGLWLCLWRRRWRLAGVPVIAAGLFGFTLAVPPVLMITHDARLAGVRDGDGRWLLSSTRREAFVRESWLRRVGATAAGSWPVEGPSAGGSLQCDGLGCLFRHENWLIAIIRDPRAAAEDCAAADAVISFVPVDRTCRPRSGIVVDRFDLWRNGAHALWADEKGIRVRSSRADRGDRPWVGVP